MGALGVATNIFNVTSIVMNNGDYDSWVQAISAINYSIVAPVPIPAAIWMFASGLVGLGAFRKRQSAISAIA